MSKTYDWPKALPRLSGTLIYFDHKDETWYQAKGPMAAAYAAYVKKKPYPTNNPWEVIKGGGQEHLASTLFMRKRKTGMKPLRVDLLQPGDPWVHRIQRSGPKPRR